MRKFIERARAGAPAERGFYMVWFALTFVAVTAFAALALEYNRWNGIATKAQKTADAAALAGAVFLPDNVTGAYNTAQATATKNGMTNNSNGVTVQTVVGSLPNQLKVTVSVTTHNPFAQIVGYNSETIVRSAVAEYQLPQNLGSPQNSYGNNPESNLTQPQFWGNVFGPSSQKSKGDAIQSAGPSSASSNCNADNCGGSVNKDYDTKGYFYGIDVPAGKPSLNVQVFDPGFVHVGDNCGSSDGNANNSLTKAATLTAAQIPNYNTLSPTIPPSTRYAPSGTSAFCTGDMYYSDGSNTANPWTVWKLRGPDATPWDATDNPVLCQAEFPGIYPEASNDQPNGTIDANHLYNLLQQSTNYPGTNPGMPFASFFRQWVTICNVNNPDAGTYFLEVETVTKINGTAAPNGGGANRWSVRTGVGTDYSTGNGLKVYGNQRMGVYANATGADTQFYLTRVPPGDAGHTLVLEFFDVGDSTPPAGVTPYISVVPPADSNSPGGAFAGCVYTPPPGNSTGPPWGTLTATGSGCKIAINHSAYDSQWITFEIPIPNDYTCDTSTALGCWAKLDYTYGPGASVSDTTTWEAFILGDPVRLIK
jgi:hypothetical protein